MYKQTTELSPTKVKNLVKQSVEGSIYNIICRGCGKPSITQNAHKNHRCYPAR